MSTNVDNLVQTMAAEIGIAEPKHSHDPKSSMTHTLNTSRRNGTPYVGRHCACPGCKHGFTHIPAVSR
jgi:hypothetical protein